MEYETESWAVDKLIAESNANNLKINPEYQRGRAWSGPQQKQFIDSILRGYPVPTIFLHNKTGKTDNKMYDIVDGQQRINALSEYLDGSYDLLSYSQAGKRFPSLVYGKHNDGEWVGKRFTNLPHEQQNTLKRKKVPIVILQGDDNEVRDLFIRLQEGSVLNDQERRDAWPGDFTIFIFEIGGRSDMYSPHPFFEKVMHISAPRPPKGSRGRIRKIATQLYQLHSSYATNMQLKGIGKTELNQLYMENFKFSESDPQENTRNRFKECLNMLNIIFDASAKTNRGRLRNHGAFHLMLLATSLLENFSTGECVQVGRNLKEAHKDFNDKCAAANRMSKLEKENDLYWREYLLFTTQDADSPHTIKRRHKFFLEKMSEKMSNSELKFSGPNPPPDGLKIIRRVCQTLDQEVCDLHDDLFDDSPQISANIDKFLAFRKGIKLDGLDWKVLRDEGRR